jgi:hypothetical protein
MLANPHRVQVQEHIVHHGVGARSLVGRVRLTEQRSPQRTAAQGHVYTLEELSQRT